jgi:hypothetical protein
MARYIRTFEEGGAEQKDLLGGKGANLAEMTKLGLPVPPGFTITTEACRYYLAQGEEPQLLRVQVTMALRRLEDQLGRRLGDVQDPLLAKTICQRAKPLCLFITDDRHVLLKRLGGDVNVIQHGTSFWLASTTTTLRLRHHSLVTRLQRLCDPG